MEGKTLTDYDRIGERGFQKVVGLFYSLVLLDADLAPYFDGRRMIDLREHQVQFLSYVAGGPAYSGRDIATAHSGLGITAEHFDKVGKYLVQSLQTFDVPADIVQRLVAAAVGLKSQIVED